MNHLGKFLFLTFLWCLFFQTFEIYWLFNCTKWWHYLAHSFNFIIQTYFLGKIVLTISAMYIDNNEYYVPRFVYRIFGILFLYTLPSTLFYYVVSDMFEKTVRPFNEYVRIAKLYLFRGFIAVVFKH